MDRGGIVVDDRCHGPRLSTSHLTLLAAIGLLFFSLPARAEWPFNTPEAATLPTGDLKLSVSAEVRDHIAGGSAEIYSVPSLEIRLGLGQIVEARLDYQFLYLDDNEEGFGGVGSGDVTLFTKVSLLRAEEMRPALSLDMGVKLPNADEGSGFGTDETDFFTHLLARVGSERISIDLAAGFAILGDPSVSGEQLDVFVYGAVLSGWLNERVGAGLEAEGGWGPDHDLHWLRGALRTRLSVGELDLVGAAALNGETPDWWVGVGYSIRWHLFDLGNP
jgi:hypothetical protein